MRIRAVAIAAIASLFVLVACASEPARVTDADYLADLEAICADTTATIEALPQPPEEIPVTAFAASAASALANEAERVRSLAVPDSLDDDHRAFVLNTDGQVGAWRAISEAGDDELGALTTRVGELIRGRNDLATEMGASGCRRGDV